MRACIKNPNYMNNQQDNVKSFLEFIKKRSTAILEDMEENEVIKLVVVRLVDNMDVVILLKLLAVVIIAASMATNVIRLQNAHLQNT
uniref:Uncharacterized protein n=1 Tax=Acrobeloides nanus TaxID=290746 RepID=A0A914DTT8_9BILA